MKSPLQRLPSELAELATVTDRYKDPDLVKVTTALRRHADMLTERRFGDYGVVQADGRIVPTGRERMPRKR